MDVERVKAHRTTKDKIEMSHFERFVTEGDEKTKEFAKAGAMLDEGFMAEVRAKTVQQDPKRCMQPCSTHPAFTAWRRNGKIVKSSSRSQKKGRILWMRKGRKQSIEGSGLLRPTSIDL